MGNRLALLAFLLLGCERSISSSEVAPIGSASSIPSIAQPIGSRWVVERGDTLAEISRRVYGHKDYMHLVAAFNGDHETRLRVGEKLDTPPIPALFLSVHFAYPDFAVLVDKARADYHALLLDYVPLRRAGGQERMGATMALPPPLAARFRAVEANLTEARASIDAHLQPTHKRPSQLLGQLEGAAAEASHLGLGHVDGYAYDIDMVDQRIAKALLYAYVWQQRSYQ